MPNTTNMPMTSKVFVDTNIFVALKDKNDSTHKEAKKIALYLKKKNIKLYTSSDVIGETLTVLSRKLGKKVARSFFDNYLKSGVSEIFIDDIIHDEARKLFFKITSKNISFIDCSSAIAMEQSKIDVVFTFDKHFKSLGAKLIEDNI